MERIERNGIRTRRETMWILIRSDFAYNRNRMIGLYACLVPLIIIAVSLGLPIQMIFFLIGFSLGMTGIIIGMEERREYRIRLLHTLPVSMRQTWLLLFTFVAVYVISLMLLTGAASWLIRPAEFSSDTIRLITIKTLLLFIATIGSYINYDLYFGKIEKLDSVPLRLVNFAVMGMALLFYFIGPQWEKSYRLMSGLMQFITESGFIIICLAVLIVMIVLDHRLYIRRKTYLQ